MIQLLKSKEKVINAVTDGQYSEDMYKSVVSDSVKHLLNKNKKILKS
jgi:hypothetical protein